MNDIEADISALRMKVDQAIRACERHRCEGDEETNFFIRVQGYLLVLDTKLAQRDLQFDYLREFPIGNIIVHELYGDPDKKTIALLNEIDSAFLKLIKPPEYVEFLKDFEELI